jgi:glucuronosyltransferase
MRDQIDNPLSRAVYWIEYVIRHQGAPHLKSNAFCEKSIIEREMLDVYLIISIFLLLLAYIPIRLTSRVGSNILKRLQRGNKIKMQ